jgi:hypothetical protein
VVRGGVAPPAFIRVPKVRKKGGFVFVGPVTMVGVRGNPTYSTDTYHCCEMEPR